MLNLFLLQKIFKSINNCNLYLKLQVNSKILFFKNNRLNNELYKRKFEYIKSTTFKKNDFMICNIPKYTICNNSINYVTMWRNVHNTFYLNINNNCVITDIIIISEELLNNIRIGCNFKTISNIPGELIINFTKIKNNQYILNLKDIIPLFFNYEHFLGNFFYLETFIKSKLVICTKNIQLFEPIDKNHLYYKFIYNYSYDFYISSGCSIYNRTKPNKLPVLIDNKIIVNIPHKDIFYGVLVYTYKRCEIKSIKIKNLLNLKGKYLKINDKKYFIPFGNYKLNNLDHNTYYIPKNTKLELKFNSKPNCKVLFIEQNQLVFNSDTNHLALYNRI